MKRLSVLHILPSFDINGVAVDYMHCILEGIGKRLSMLWFTSSSTDYYILSTIKDWDQLNWRHFCVMFAKSLSSAGITDENKFSLLG